MKEKMITSIQAMAALLSVTAGIVFFATLSERAGERKEYEDIAEAHVSVNAGAALTEGRALAGRDLAGGEAADGETASAAQPLQAAPHRRLSVDFDALTEINGQTVGWLYIEGTPVNYPVVQAADNSYYLNRSFAGEASKSGAIFLDKDLDLRESDAVILYGHNMGPGRSEMFSSLSGYDKRDYLEEHSEVITVSADGAETVWTVFAVLHVDTARAEGAALFGMRGGIGDELYEEYIQLIESHRLYDTGVAPAAGQRLLMLSTCRGEGSRSVRRLVFAYS